MTTLRCGAVLFDLDGVLADSTANVERHWRTWAAGHGLDGDAIMRVVHGRRAVESIPMLAPGLDVAREMFALEAAEAGDTDGVLPVPGAAALLSRLPPGAWAIVTSGTRAVATARLRRVGILVPPVLVTADDVRHGKPHPEGYLAAAAALGVPPARCVVVEDTPPGIAAAHAGGMRAIGVATTYPAERLAEAEAVAGRLADIEVEASPDGIRLTVGQGERGRLVEDAPPR